MKDVIKKVAEENGTSVAELSLPIIMTYFPGILVLAVSTVPLPFNVVFFGTVICLEI